MTEREKMDLGMWYDANYDKELVEKRLDAEELCFLLNNTNPRDTGKRMDLLQKLFPNCGKDTSILSPILTDYGYNCFIGDHSFINHNAYLMDGAPIRIGKHAFIGPNCGMYTATHPYLPEERNKGFEKALPITIGDNVWIGAYVTILPGVTIGDNCIIGANSLVSKDIPSGVLAVGNPCRIIREITPEDTIFAEGI